jgi:hypothetical protein
LSFWESLQRRLATNRSELVIVAGLFIIALGVYIRTMCPSVFSGDSAEMTVAAYYLGIMHPPGHPTFLLIGKLFTMLPFGDVAYRLNFMSGFFAAITVAGVYLICRQLLRSHVAGIVAALLLAFSYFFWAESVIAEVYTLNTAFFVVLVLMLFVWQKRQSEWLLLATAFVYGVSIGSHICSVLFAPGFLAFLIVNRHPKQNLFKSIAGMIPCFVLGCAVFLYLPIRFQSGALNLNGWFDINGVYQAAADLTTIEGLRWYLSGQMFEQMMFAYDLPAFLGELVHYIGWLWQSFVGIGIVIGVVGLFKQVRDYPKQAIWLGLLFICPFLFYVDYGALDKDTMFLVTYAVWSIWIGFGVDAILDQIKTVSSVAVRNRATLVPFAQLCLLIVPLLALCVNFKYVDLSGDSRVSVRETGILHNAEQNAIILTTWSEIQALNYFQKVEGLRQDVLVIEKASFAAEKLESYVKKNITDTTIYVTDYDYRLLDHYELQPLVVGYRVVARESADNQ